MIAGSRLHILVKRYIKLKILREDPEPLEFTSDFNPLISQRLPFDDPCMIPIKVNLFLDRVHDGYYSIKVDFKTTPKLSNPMSIIILY